MAETVTVVISTTEEIWDNPLAGNYIEVKMNAHDSTENHQLLSLVTFFCEKGFYVYTCYEDGTRLNMTRAFNDMRDFEKRHPDV